MSKSSILTDFCRFIAQNDIAHCRGVMLPLSNSEIDALVNSKVGGWPYTTPVHFASAENVDLGIWELLLPWAHDDTLFSDGTSPLSMLIIDFCSKSKRSELYTGRPVLKPLRQLKKIRCLLERTKTLTSDIVQHHKTRLLCELCLLQGCKSPGYATLHDIRNIAEDMLQKYNVRLSSRNSAYHPLHWALENDNLCLLKVFLTHGADPNCLDNNNLTPLQSEFTRRKRMFFLPCVGLLLENGARLDAEDKSDAKTAFLSVLIKLSPSELDVFMKKYHLTWNMAVERFHLFPPLHGLIFHAIRRSPYRNDRQKLQLDIVSKAKVLFKHGLQLELVELHGRTVLHFACWFKYLKVVEFLISFGADILKRDVLGRGCLYYIVSQPVKSYGTISGGEELRTLQMVVREIGSKLFEIVDNLGRSAIHFAVFENNYVALRHLLEIGFDVSTCDFKGKSVLNYAVSAKKTCTDVIKKFSFNSKDMTLLEFSVGNQKESAAIIQPTQKCIENKHVSDHGISGNKANIAENSYEENVAFPNKPPQENRSELNMVRLLLTEKYSVLKENEVSHLIDDMNSLIAKLANGLAWREPRFQATTKLAGSVSEGTKLKPPNEFDFQFHLEIISPYLCIETLIENDVQLGIVLHGDNSIILEDLFREKDTVNETLFRMFHTVVYKVLADKTFWEDLPFYWCYHNQMVSETNKSVFGQGTITNPLYLTWTGPQDSDINISVDLVPVIVLEHLPSSIIKKIPQRVIDTVDRLLLKWHIICRDSNYARLSFCPVEKWILSRLIPELREAYTLAKSVIMCCSEVYDNEINDITSYMLKNALFSEMDPSTKFCLLDDQVIPSAFVSDLQEIALNTLRQTATKERRHRDVFIHRWAWKLFDRLERWFSEDKGVHIYCSPSVTFPDCVLVSDSKNEDPYIRSLRLLKTVVSDRLNKCSNRKHHLY